ncbi:MAG: mevalonate kinase [Methanocalculus sp. MSAO_Arc2]|uniref:mevalonate kinase n=1 Tax=Methanocalculus sp. MSAO_Arc2 TaxID=2293855 RepID=UPI000FECE60A|nr:MAG: mevalonate kinase [Methanocalculus sp. MSAO_Arc2]
MATWSAPGKIFLFGEHAVVYGKPGIAMAIKPRVMVTVRKAKRQKKPNSSYIAECFRQMGVLGSVYVRSQLPSSSGLGSSAAVTVATLNAINDEFDMGKSLEELAGIAHTVEKNIQDGRASATDTYVSTFGGMVLITGDAKRRLPPLQMQLVIGNSLTHHSTSSMVARVAELKRKRPEIADPIIDAIAAVTTCAMHHFNNPRELGNLMNMNHALLDALGVGHPQLSRLVLAARAAGALGAKMTGAGGGGCMFALCSKSAKTRVAGAIEACDARAIITGIDTQGVRKEKDE